MDITARHDSNDNLVAVQDNELIRAAYQMELVEKRLLLLAISKINSNTAPKPNSCIKVTVTTDDWGELYDAKNGWRDMRDASRGLLGRQVTISPMDKKRTKVMNWLDSCEYIPGQSKVEITFGWSVSVYLAGMVEQFTQVDMLDVAKFTSKHAVRTFELLQQMRSDKSATSWLQMSVDEYKVCLGIAGSYERFAELKRVVIEPVVKELNVKANMKLNVEYIKDGRKVVALKFIYSRQMDMFSASEKADRDLIA